MDSSQRPLRGALIGFGFIGSQGHLPAYLKRKDVDIVAIADICEERRALAGITLPEARLYTHGEILIEAEKENLDFVDIATPPVAHGPLAALALENGLHVLCEKPLTATLEETKNLRELALKHERVLFPCHNYRFAPVVRAISEVIQSGRIGRVHSVTLQTFRNTHAKGVPEWNTHWRRDFKYSGGGIAMDHGSHSFYLTFDWLQSYPTAVTAFMAKQTPQYDTEDLFTALVQFPTGTAQVYLTWTAGTRKVIYTIQGEKGGITVDDDEMQVATQVTTDGPDVAQGAIRWETERMSISSHWMDASHAEWFSPLFDRFSESISKKQFFGKEAEDAYFCLELIEKSYQSARTASTQQKITPPSFELVGFQGQDS